MDDGAVHAQAMEPPISSRVGVERPTTVARTNLTPAEITAWFGQALGPSGDVVPSSLPGGDSAVAALIGSYDQVGPIHEALGSWVGEQGGTTVGDPWEALTSPEERPDPATRTTEVLQPYRRDCGGDLG